jgi:drug/metabolite transporter (DMT)-like permease
LEPSPLLPWIYGLIIAAAVCFVAGVVARFIRHKEGTLWYRGTIALLAFAMTLLLLAIYFVQANLR